MTGSTHRVRVLVYLTLGLMVQVLGSLPRVIRIGGLFGDEESVMTENMFKYAVYRINHEPDLLKGTTLEYDIRQVQNSDQFRASKDICGQVKKGVMTLFGPESSEIASYTNSLCSYLHIPHLEFREDMISYNLQSGFSINIHPSAEELAEAYLDVIKSYDMKHVLIIYGHIRGLLKMQTLMRTLTNVLTQNIAIRQVNMGNARGVLKEAKRNNWRNMIVDLDMAETANFMKTALQEGMIDSYHHFILTTLEIEGLDLDDYKHNYVNLTGFRLVNPNDDYSKSVIEGMYYYEMETRLKLLHRTNYNTIPYKSALLFDAVLLFANALRNLDSSLSLRPNNASCNEEYIWRAGKHLYDYLKQSEINGLTGKIQIHEGRRMQFNLDIMQLKESGLQHTGTWRFKEGVNFTSTHDHTYSFFDNRTLIVGSVLNRELIVATKLEAPYVMKKDIPKDMDPTTLGNDLFEGFCIDLLQEIATMIGFKYKIIQTRDNVYGNYIEKNDSWNGLVRDLLERKADMAVAALTISYIREQAIDFTKPFLNLGISILFKTPEKKKPGIFSFLNPLAVDIWIYVVSAYVVVSFSIFILARFSPYEWYNPHPCNPETDTVENTFGISNSFWFTVGTLMQQGSDVNPRAISTRIVGATWWFFTLIIISSYTANLAAFLTVERMDSPISSAEDLAKQTEIPYGLLAGGATQRFFKESKNPTYQAMWNFMESKRNEVFTASSKIGVEIVRKGNFAYLMESTSIDYVVQQHCDLMQVGGLLDAKGYGIGTPMASPLRDMLSMAILSLQEQGKIQELYNKWWKGSSHCVSERKKIESKANALNVDNIGGIFVVLVGGLALAVCTAFVEFIWKSKRNAREDRQSLCSEMAQELRFAVRCHGSTKKPKIKNKCVKCSNTGHRDRSVTCPLTAETSGDTPANGIIHLRELRKSPVPPGKEFKFGDGSYLHVDYSDTET